MMSRLDMINDTLDTEKYDILVLPAPKTDLTTDSVQKLQNFMYNDGKLASSWSTSQTTPSPPRRIWTHS